MASQLLTRHGIVTRETVAAEAVTGGFTAVYQVLRAMEDAGRIRRGYFVAGLGGAQFAMPAALDLLRAMRERPDQPNTVALAATDPANPYGRVLKWPAAVDGEPAQGGRGPVRGVGAVTILVDGSAAAYLRRGERELLLFTPETEPDRSRVARQVARMLLRLAASRDEARRGMLIAEINGEPAATVALAGAFVDEGFVATAMGLQAKPERLRLGVTNHSDTEDAETP
jgi:ATP-dependent Lhr-like helicase